MVDLMSLLRDVLVCSLQVWMLNDFGKNMFPYRVEPLWKRIGVYFAAALYIFIANHMGTTLFNIAIIPASYTIAAIIIFQGKNVTLRLIANNLCLHMCPYSIMHGTVQGHFSCSDSCSRGDIDYCLMKCLSTKIEDMSNLISSDWIRPEDLCYYEKLCEETDNFNLSIKLVERTKSTKFLTRVVEAYARRQYKGNLLDILLWPKSDDMVVKTEPTAEEMKTMAELYNISQMFNYSKIFDLPNIYIDNTKLDGFLKKFVDDYACNHKICVSKQNIDVTDSNYCSYCSSWVQRAIIYNGEQVEKWIDNCREFEKALDRSEVFRSVL